MILVDSSVWIDHFRRRDARLAELLEARQVLSHPCVVGELALGSLRQRELIVASLRDLPSTTIATDTETLRFIADHTLYGRGIGYVDAQILAATRLTPGALLWTHDKALLRVAGSMQLAADF